MGKIKVGIVGFGKTGKLVVNECLKEKNFDVLWVLRRSKSDIDKFASRLLGFEDDRAQIYSIEDVTDDFFTENKVDVIIDFSGTKGCYAYTKAAKNGIRIISAISKYEPEDLAHLESLSKDTALIYSPNITLGINFLIVASQILQKIAPHADVEIVEEHFRNKQEASGTAVKIAKILNLNEEEHVNSIRVGGIVGKHEIIFGLPNQTIRLVHESISKAAFGQGAIFAAKWLNDKPKGLYNMEGIITDMFNKNIPIYSAEQ